MVEGSDKGGLLARAIVRTLLMIDCGDPTEGLRMELGPYPPPYYSETAVRRSTCGYLSVTYEGGP